MTQTHIPVLVAHDVRFSLRPFYPTDVPALVRHINSSHIADRVSHVPNPYTEEDAIDWLNVIARAKRLCFTQRIDYAIDIAGELVGSVAFINIDGHKAQLSYWLGDAYHGRGIMTEAVKLLIAYGQQLGFTRIWAYTYGNNVASQAVLEKAGLTFEGVHRKEWLKNCVYHDSHMYAIVV